MCLTVPWRRRRSSSVLRKESKFQSEQLSSLRCVILACGLQRQLFSEIQLVSPARCLSTACSLQHEVLPCRGADLMQLPWTWSTLRSPCRRASWGFPGEESQCSSYGWCWAEARKPSLCWLWKAMWSALGCGFITSVAVLYQEHAASGS